MEKENIKLLIKEIRNTNEVNTEFLLDNFFHRLRNSKILVNQEKQILIDYLAVKKYLIVNPLLIKNEKIITELSDNIVRIEEKIEQMLKNIKSLEEDYNNTFAEKNKTKFDLKQKELLEKIHSLNLVLPFEQKIENNDKYLDVGLLDGVLIKVGFKKSHCSKKMQYLISSYEDKQDLLIALRKYQNILDIIETFKVACEQKREHINDKKEQLGSLKLQLIEEKEKLQSSQEELLVLKVEDFAKVSDVFKGHYKEILTENFIQEYEPIIKKLCVSVENLKSILKNNKNINDFLDYLENNKKPIAFIEKSLKILLKDIEDVDYYNKKDNSISNFLDTNVVKVEKTKVAL